jgi:hypothetical protein
MVVLPAIPDLEEDQRKGFAQCGVLALGPIGNLILI